MLSMTKMENTTKGDFTANVHLVWIAGLAIIVGVLCAFVALALLWQIGLFTYIFYYPADFFSTLVHHPGTLITLDSHTPADNRLGLFSILVPVVGGLIIGLLARYGTDRIRGHGIPEAIEAILIGRSRMSPKVALLKPLSSAISIGSGGPFGAEGPIIMTGGATGSIIAQAFHLTAAERKTLLVAGAAGGMSATFATPVAAVLLAVELLLFEWKPRSLVPVALASTAAALVRRYLLGTGPLFPVSFHGQLDSDTWMTAAVLGLVLGLLALLLTGAVYAMEDAFHRVRFHWMWWPAIGGVIVGVGGYLEPHALGVGYDLIRGMLQGNVSAIIGHADSLTLAVIILVVVKAIIWAVALGSGTSGGVLAPLLIMGAGLGTVLSPWLHGNDPALWSLVSVAAILGGTMRSPLTGTVFALELTHDINTLPALLVSSVVAYSFTVLVMKRSILTEKIARRGYHVSREYEVDPLERLMLDQVMTTDVVTVPASLPASRLLKEYFLADARGMHQAYPVVDAEGRVVGVVSRSNLLDEWIVGAAFKDGRSVTDHLDPLIAYDLTRGPAITAYPWESCRSAAERMVEKGVGRLPIIAADGSGKMVGLVTRSDLLKARAHTVEEELTRERTLLR